MSDATPVLHAGPLILRLLRPGDANTLCWLAADKRIAAATISIPHPYTHDHAASFIQHAQQEHEKRGSAIFAMTWVLSDDSPARTKANKIGAPSALHGACLVADEAHAELVGTVSLVRQTGENAAELGYWVGVPYWGQGFAQLAARAILDYAFGTLKLASVRATCFANNGASSRVLAKVGMHREKVLERSREKWGIFQDEELWVIEAA